jgi:glycerol-3-phosphate dehydrogenase (NAD(P)+)
MERVAVLGDGAWGTALSMVLVERGAAVVQWSWSEQRALELQTSRMNRKYLAGFKMPDRVTVTHEAGQLQHADLIVSAVPSRYLADVLGRLKPFVPRGRPVVSATKGLEFPSRRRATEIVTDVLGERPVAVVSGPSHAEEVVEHLPTAVVAASSDAGLALRVQDLLTTDRFRVYTSNDPIGVELGGALKNVLAIAGGMVDGLQLGDNAKAALLTRGQAEMARLGVALGGQRDTFNGLSGIGDLVVSCISRHGRNRLVGERIGRGEKLEQILAGIPGVPEGVLTCKAVVELAGEVGVDMPISSEIQSVLFEGKDPRRAVADLMLRQQKDEIEV